MWGADDQCVSSPAESSPMFDWGLHPNTSKYRCRDLFKHHNTPKYLKTQISVKMSAEKEEKLSWIIFIFGFLSWKFSPGIFLLKFSFLGWSFYFWHFYPWDENFLSEIFTSLAPEGGPKLLCVVIGNISQEEILDNLPPGNLKDERFFRKKYLTYFL